MKKFLMSVMLVAMITAFAACGNQEESNNNNEQSNNETTEAATENESDELTPQSIITKAGEKAQEMEGMHYIMDTTQMIEVADGEENTSIDQDINMEMKMTQDPMTMYMDGTIKAQGMEMDMENYFVDGKMYTKSGPNPWIVVDGMDLEDMQEQVQGQDPSQVMEQFNDMIDAISEEGGEDALSIEEQDDEYVITMDLDEAASDKMLDIVKEQSEATFSQLEDAGIPDVMDNMKINSVKQVFYIDKETFAQNKLEQQMDMEMTVEDATMNINQDMNMELQGEVTEEITVPDDVIDQAQEISLEELEEAQQQQ